MLTKSQLALVIILVCNLAEAQEQACRWEEVTVILPPKVYHASPAAGTTQQGLREEAYCETLPKDQLNWRAYQKCVSEAYVRDAERRTATQGRPVSEVIRTRRCVPIQSGDVNAKTENLDRLSE
jgi:hypothetical protein